LIHLAKNVPTEKMQKVRQSHKASESIELDQIQVLEDGAGYLIMSSSDPSQQYHIQTPSDPMSFTENIILY